MIEKIKRYFFWLIIDDQNEDWEDFWKRKNYQQYLQFRAYIGDEDWGVLTGKQRKQHFANFTESRDITDSNDRQFLTGTTSDFEIKYLLWTNLL